TGRAHRRVLDVVADAGQGAEADQSTLAGLGAVGLHGQIVEGRMIPRQPHLPVVQKRTAMLRPLDEPMVIQLHVVHNLKLAVGQKHGMIAPPTGRSIMTNTLRRFALSCLLAAAGLALSQAAQAAGYNPVAQQAQSKLATLGFNPGTLDGVAGSGTKAAVQAFQKQSGLPETGDLDAATLDKLGIGSAVDKPVADWRPTPMQDELDQLIAKPTNDPGAPYTD